ncbi:hypothetical protein FQZ97_769400 [compost metagenome]
MREVVGDHVGRLRGARVHDEVARDQRREFGAGLAHQPQRHVDVAQRRARRDERPRADQHARIVEQHRRVALPEEGGQPPGGGRLVAREHAGFRQHESADARGGDAAAVFGARAQCRAGIADVGALQGGLQRLGHLAAERWDDEPVGGAAGVGQRVRHRHGEALGGAHALAGAHDGDVERRHVELQHGGEFVRGGEDVEHRGQAGVEHAVEGEDIEFHGNNDTKDVKKANGPEGGSCLESMPAPRNPVRRCCPPRRCPMIKFALFARLEAKPGKEAAVQQFLEAGLAMAREEKTTPIWFALRLSPSTFGVFDAFEDEAGRQAHLTGPM